MRYWLFALLLLSLTTGVVWSQSDTTSIPQPLQSIFDYDICAPPCWMGLISGESTVEDVEQMLHANEDLIPPETLSVANVWSDSEGYAINPETGNLQIGGYYFDLGEVERTPGQVTSRISFDEGYIDDMLILAHETIPLADGIAEHWQS
ncbi:MAG: hypothetical protein Q9P01_14245 [Anaerolineae bacterium]|nr:hypothetical protein [Anaerolineae bacterium]MDQ7035942.1 hypothetical protein [Anaerolineae bacterium]